MEQWKLALVMGVVALGGVAVGAWAFGAPAATAQTPPFRDCVIVRQESVDVNDSGEVQRIGLARTIRIPPGYTPIGGGGLGPNWVGAMVLCR